MDEWQLVGSQLVGSQFVGSQLVGWQDIVIGVVSVSAVFLTFTNTYLTTSLTSYYHISALEIQCGVTATAQGKRSAL